MMGIYTGVLFLQKKNKEIFYNKNGQAPRKRLPIFVYERSASADAVIFV